LCSARLRQRCNVRGQHEPGIALRRYRDAQECRGPKGRECRGISRHYRRRSDAAGLRYSATLGPSHPPEMYARLPRLPRCRIGASPSESRLSLSEKNHPTHMVHCAWLTTMSMTSSGLTPASFTASSGRRIMPAQGCSARHLRVRSSRLGFTRNSRSQHNRSSIASFPARLDSSRDTADDRSPTDPFERTRTLGRAGLRRRQGPRIDCSHIPQRRPRSRRMTTTMRRTSTTPPAGVSLRAVRPSRARSKHCSLLPFWIQQKIFRQPPPATFLCTHDATKPKTTKFPLEQGS
jgi:hypothetical protein